MAAVLAQAEYDQQAEAYSKCKRAAWRDVIERDIAQRMFGDHATPGEITYDLACGDGFHTRWLASSGLFENNQKYLERYAIVGDSPVWVTLFLSP